MADQPGELRRINWDECFPFTRLFKTFRMAIQPAKLGLALAGVILMGIWGGLLDLVWPNSLEPVGPEVSLYWQVADVGTWRDAQKAQRLAAVQDVYGPAGLLQGKGPGGLEELRSSKAVGQALAKLKAEYADAVTQAQGDESKIAALAQRYRAEHARLAAFKTRGIFSSFLRYEQQVVLNLLDQARSVLMLDFEAVTRGTEAVVRGRRGGAEEQRADGFGHIGIIGSVLLMYRGVQWMIAEHFLFAVLFLLGSLAIWSLFGGAVCRIAALNAARDEQISPKAALTFAKHKFFGFFTAPLLPLIMIVLIGVLEFAGGLVILSIPYVGEVLGGILMILALVGGFVMAMIAVGALGGGGLLWPTIAVEGSDGFDAMSRSYSYFYSRPWRLTFYSIVAAIYGAVTYIALRYFVYVMIQLTRLFVGWGTFGAKRPGTGVPGATKLDAMWPAPAPGSFMGDGLSLGLMRWEGFGSLIIHLWVLLLVLALCAYLVSFYFSAATIIYYLLRQKVDATDFEDVFIEEEEESVESPIAAPAAALPTGSQATSGEPAPATPPPATDSPGEAPA